MHVLAAGNVFDKREGCSCAASLMFQFLPDIAATIWKSDFLNLNVTCAAPQKLKESWKAFGSKIADANVPLLLGNKPICGADQIPAPIIVRLVDHESLSELRAGLAEKSDHAAGVKRVPASKYVATLHQRRGWEQLGPLPKSDLHIDPAESAALIIEGLSLLQIIWCR